MCYLMEYEKEKKKIFLLLCMLVEVRIRNAFNSVWFEPSIGYKLKRKYTENKVNKFAVIFISKQKITELQFLFHFLLVFGGRWSDGCFSEKFTQKNIFCFRIYFSAKFFFFYFYFVPLTNVLLRFRSKFSLELNIFFVRIYLKIIDCYGKKARTKCVIEMLIFTFIVINIEQNLI